MPKHTYDIAVMIGRFQPVHNAHLQVLSHALEIANHVIVVIGSHNASPSTRNPWTTQDRTAMVMEAVHHDPRVTCIVARDYLYNNNVWLQELQNRIDKEVQKIANKATAKIALVGCKKDNTSFYLDFFPQWTLVEHDLIPDMDATKIRESFFAPPIPPSKGWSDKEIGILRAHHLRDWKSAVPPSVQSWLLEYTATPAYMHMVQEFSYIEDYKSRWKGTPFKPVFVTVDAVVIRSGHVLVVRRGRTPGKGLLALPGGFIGDESIREAAIRELVEETEIALPWEELNRSIVDSKVFDHPQRSARGRTITHAFCFDLGQGSLPSVRGADDACEAMWLSLREVHQNETQFFEDHLHIITHFSSKF
jgi:bifunctional NMN adenylyltransferase/nudix hydrolase